MSHITLTVTAKVLQQSARAKNQEQMAIRKPSQNLQINAGCKANPIVISINGTFDLRVGDTGAIWQIHQKTPSQQADFAYLYAVLSRWPGSELTFRW